MARRVEPMAGDEVRFRRGRHTHIATFIRHSARGAKAHVFTDGTHTQVQTHRITHIRARSAKERAEALAEPERVAETVHRNLGEHRLANDAAETLRVVREERHQARASYAIIHLAYHGHEGHARSLAEDLEDGRDPALVAADGERLMASLERPQAA